VLVKRFANVTSGLIAINVIAYIWEVRTGTDFDSDQSLTAHGALLGTLVLQGQWWRIVTSGFLHAGVWHIALNMFALYQLGTFVEVTLGSTRMLTIYAISLLGGGLAVTFFSPNEPTVGASGAIFGLFGALLAIGVRMGKRGRSLIAQVVPVLVLNLVFTFAVPFISKAGHLGGLISGFLATLPLVMLRRRQPEPVVVDTGTGAHSEADYLAPGEEPEGDPAGRLS
jgi:membrane associated rhomboid family serine protease